MKIAENIPRPVKKMILRAAAGTVAGELLRRVMDGGNGRGAKSAAAAAKKAEESSEVLEDLKTASNDLKAAFRKLSGKAAFDERMSGLGRKAAAAVADAILPEKPSRVKLKSIHGSKNSMLDRLANLGLNTAIDGPIERVRKRKHRTDAAGTAAVALAKVLLRVKR
ncbi:MAG: hypothetical protein IIZ51_11475 [Lachnospiraceae bacterium]|nr:hypothetical protein [Lachnospiraceae bacterium]